MSNNTQEKTMQNLAVEITSVGYKLRDLLKEYQKLTVDNTDAVVLWKGDEQLNEAITAFEESIVNSDTIID